MCLWDGVEVGEVHFVDGVAELGWEFEEMVEGCFIVCSFKKSGEAGDGFGLCSKAAVFAERYQLLQGTSPVREKVALGATDPLLSC